METVNRPWWFEMACRSAAVDVPTSGDSADSTTSASGARTSRAAVTRSPGSSDLRGSDVVAVVRGDGRRDQRVGHAGDLAPVELDAGVGRLDHGDVGPTGGAQPSGDADACGAAAEDEDSGLGHVPSWTSRVDRDEHVRCAGGTGALPEGRATLR